MNDYLALALGIISAGVGGELFVRGIVGLAHWARVSAAIIGATVAAFATSTPELAVAITAALAGTPQISLGNALGSNVVNVALILGLTLLTGRIRSSRDGVKRDFLVALFSPVAIGVLSIDGLLSRVDGLILFAQNGPTLDEKEQAVKAGLQKSSRMRLVWEQDISVNRLPLFSSSLPMSRSFFYWLTLE